VFYSNQMIVGGDLNGGGDTLYDVANDGIGYGTVRANAPDRDALIAKLDDVSKQIADGDLAIARP
jgi:hypothetical protein